jgi:streptogramin lyase
MCECSKMRGTTSVGNRSCGGGATAPQPLPIIAIIIALAALNGASCADRRGNRAPDVRSCTSDGQCPVGQLCDLASGTCAEPRDDREPGCAPVHPGCQCTAGAVPISCLTQPADQRLVDSCARGQSVCAAGVYQPCETVVDANCSAVGLSAGDFPINDRDASQVELGPEGELVLAPGLEQPSFGSVWIANTGDNTVSKIDVETGREVARYAAVRDSLALGVPAVPIGGFDGDENNCGNCPSRTAIDFHGDAFVANRAFALQGTVSKFANAVEDCVDRNGNGVIETSTDANGDGRISIDDPLEFFGELDECILWTVPVGGVNGIPRGLAVDAGGVAGEVWVGLYRESRVIQISGQTGAAITAGGAPVSVATPGVGPYGAAVDGLGHLWVTGVDDGEETYLAKIDSAARTLLGIYAIPDDDDGCSKSYGIAIDTAQRVWLGGWDCNDVKAFDQHTEAWHRADFDHIDRTRGVAVDTAGNLWVAFHSGKVGKARIDDILKPGPAAPIQLFDLPPLTGALTGPISHTIGVGIDRNGACWAVSRNDNAVHGTATRIAGNGAVASFPVGHRPYTYSDFAGFGLRTIVRPEGYWRGVVEGCAGPGVVSSWTHLQWTEYEPPGTSVRIRVRGADQLQDLSDSVFSAPFDAPPVDLAAAGVLPSRYLEVHVLMSTNDAAVVPQLIDFRVEFDCL